jgi:transcriptional regulator with XRE-family HTH domain
MPHDGRIRAEAVAIRFGANLRNCRQRVAFSQKDLGEMALLHRSEVGMLERGARLGRIDTVLRLAGSLSIQVTDLLEGIEWIPGRHFAIHDPHNPTRESLGKAIETLRKSRQISLADLVARSGLDKHELEQIVRGVVEPTWGEMQLVAEALEVPFTEFCALAEKFDKESRGLPRP